MMLAQSAFTTPAGIYLACALVCLLVLVLCVGGMFVTTLIVYGFKKDSDQGRAKLYLHVDAMRKEFKDDITGVHTRVNDVLTSVSTLTGALKTKVRAKRKSTR